MTSSFFYQKFETDFDKTIESGPGIFYSLLYKHIPLFFCCRNEVELRLVLTAREKGFKFCS